MKTLQVNGIFEDVLESADCPPHVWRACLEKETISVLGYGPVGRAQALNLRDRGFTVCVGARCGGASWLRAAAEGFVPYKTLLSLESAVQRASLVFYSLSDAGQKATWPILGQLFQPGAALCFAHGFSIVYADQTGVHPRADIDVILVAPKGAGATMRRAFCDGSHLNASLAVHHDATGCARARAMAIAFALGSAYVFQTTFEREVYADLTGERGVLVGAIYGLLKAQYDVLRAAGHSPVESFSETVEEATQSLYPLIAEHGMDWMYQNCSATAQRGALDWHMRFYAAVKPLFEELYQSVQSGNKTKITLEVSSRIDYSIRLQEELRTIAESEMWKIGAQVRALRENDGAVK